MSLEDGYSDFFRRCARVANEVAKSGHASWIGGEERIVIKEEGSPSREREREESSSLVSSASSFADHNPILSLVKSVLGPPYRDRKEIISILIDRANVETIHLVKRYTIEYSPKAFSSEIQRGGEKVLFEVAPWRVSMISFVGELFGHPGVRLDLLRFGYYLSQHLRGEKTPGICGVKFDMRDATYFAGTVAKEGRTFDHQVLIHVRLPDDRIVQVKCFESGKLQLSGCKTLTEANTAVAFIVNAANRVLLNSDNPRVIVVSKPPTDTNFSCQFPAPIVQPPSHPSSDAAARQHQRSLRRQNLPLRPPHLPDEARRTHRLPPRHLQVHLRRPLRLLPPVRHPPPF